MATKIERLNFIDIHTSTSPKKLVEKKMAEINNSDLSDLEKEEEIKELKSVVGETFWMNVNAIISGCI